MVVNGGTIPRTLSNMIPFGRSRQLQGGPVCFHQAFRLYGRESVARETAAVVQPIRTGDESFSGQLCDVGGPDVLADPNSAGLNQSHRPRIARLLGISCRSPGPTRHMAFGYWRKQWAIECLNPAHLGGRIFWAGPGILIASCDHTLEHPRQWRSRFSRPHAAESWRCLAVELCSS